jgi:WD40 repeat protein
MARTPDGRKLFLARQSQVVVWDSSEPATLRRALTLPALPGQPDNERDARPRPGPPDFGRDGRRRSDASGFDRDGRPPHWSIAWHGMLASPDGTRLYLLDRDPKSRVFVLALEGDQARWVEWPLDAHPTALALSLDGRTLAVGDRGSVVLVDTARGVETARLQPPTGEAEGQVSSLAFNPGGRELAVGTQHGLIDLWSLEHPGAPQIHLPGHRGGVNALAYDPQGRHLVSAGFDRTVEVWDLNVIHDELGRLGLAW